MTPKARRCAGSPPVPASCDPFVQFPWLPKPVKDVSQDTEDLQENPSLVVFMESSDDAARQAVEDALTPLAKEFAQRAKAGAHLWILFEWIVSAFSAKYLRG